jgi:hypothetical protein
VPTQGERESPCLSTGSSAWGFENRFLSERQLPFWISGAALLYAIVWPRSLYPQEWLNCIDFGRIWLSGSLAASGDTVRVYDYAAFSAAQLSLFGPENCPLFLHFPYPPTFLFFTYPLGLMQYPIAFAAWIAATLFLYLAAVYVIVPRPAAVIVAVRSYPVFWNVLLGQTGFLTAGLMGLSLALMERRPLLSGIFLGLLTYSRNSASSSRWRCWPRVTGASSSARPP